MKDHHEGSSKYSLSEDFSASFSSDQKGKPILLNITLNNCAKGIKNK